MREKIYISLPITGCEKEAREKADLVKAKLSKQGWQPVNPFEIYVGKDATIGQYIGADLAVLIDHCDAVYVCKGWERSKGCRVEFAAAEVYDKKVMFEEADEHNYYYR